MNNSSHLHVGAIGEGIAITELLWHGWAPVNVNALISQAPNIDLLAAKGTHKVALQVKTAGPTSRAMLQVGYGKDAAFNTKEGPVADFIIFVRLFGPRDYECYVVPATEAERVAMLSAQDWAGTLKKDGSQRGKNFPICIRFEPNKNRLDVSNYKEKWQHFRDAWHLLEISETA